MAAWLEAWLSRIENSREVDQKRAGYAENLWRFFEGELQPETWVQLQKLRASQRLARVLDIRSSPPLVRRFVVMALLSLVRADAASSQPGGHRFKNVELVSMLAAEFMRSTGEESSTVWSILGEILALLLEPSVDKQAAGQRAKPTTLLRGTNLEEFAKAIRQGLLNQPSHVVQSCLLLLIRAFHDPAFCSAYVQVGGVHILAQCTKKSLCLSTTTLRALRTLVERAPHSLQVGKVVLKDSATFITLLKLMQRNIDSVQSLDLAYIEQERKVEVALLFGSMCAGSMACRSLLQKELSRFPTWATSAKATILASLAQADATVLAQVIIPGSSLPVVAPIQPASHSPASTGGPPSPRGDHSGYTSNNSGGNSPRGTPPGQRFGFESRRATMTLGTQPITSSAVEDPNLPALESALVSEDLRARARANYDAMRTALEAVLDIFPADGGAQERPPDGLLARTASEALSEAPSTIPESRPLMRGSSLRLKFPRQRAPAIAQSPLLRMSPGVRQALLAMAADSGLEASSASRPASSLGTHLDDVRSRHGGALSSEANFSTLESESVLQPRLGSTILVHRQEKGHRRASTGSCVPAFVLGSPLIPLDAELFRFSLPTSQLEEGTLASIWRWSQQCLRDVRKQMLIMPRQDYPRARPALQEKKTRIHTVECALFRLLTLERMLGTKLVWSKLEEAAASGGVISEENIARYAAFVSSSFKEVSTARLAELPVFAVQAFVLQGKDGLTQAVSLALSRWAAYTRARKKRALARWAAAVHRERTVLRAVVRRLALLRWQRQRERHAFRIIANRHKHWLVYSKWEAWRGAYISRCRGGRKIGIPELKVLSRAMTAWQARVRAFRRKKERLQLAQEFRNKTLMWEAFSLWLLYQDLRLHKAETIRVADQRRPLHLLKAGMSGLKGHVALAREKTQERARAHGFWQCQALAKAFLGFKTYPEYRKEERRLQEVARAQWMKQDLKRFFRKWTLLPQHERQKREARGVGDAAFQRLLKARALHWWIDYRLKRLEGHKMKKKAAEFRKRALLRRVCLAYVEYKEYRHVASARKGEQAELIRSFRTSVGKRKALQNFKWAVQHRHTKELTAVRVADFSHRQCLQRVLLQWGRFVEQARLDREHSRVAERHRRVGSMRRGFRVWARARTQRVQQQERSRKAEEMGRRNVLRRSFSAWRGWMAARGTGEAWDKRQEEFCLRAVVRSWRAAIGRQKAIRTALAVHALDAHLLEDAVREWRHVARCWRLQRTCVCRWRGKSKAAAFRMWAERTASLSRKRLLVRKALFRWTAAPHPLLLTVLQCFDHWRALLDEKARVKARKAAMLARAARRIKGQVLAMWRKQVTRRSRLRAVFGLVSQGVRRRVKRECLRAWKAAVTEVEGTKVTAREPVDQRNEVPEVRRCLLEETLSTSKSSGKVDTNDAKEPLRMLSECGKEVYSWSPEGTPTVTVLKEDKPRIRALSDALAISRAIKALAQWRATIAERKLARSIQVLTNFRSMGESSGTSKEAASQRMVEGPLTDVPYQT